jgi:D-alanyl-D-alanine carboxypeptidase
VNVAIRAVTTQCVQWHIDRRTISTNDDYICSRSDSIEMAYALNRERGAFGRLVYRARKLVLGMAALCALTAPVVAAAPEKPAVKADLKALLDSYANRRGFNGTVLVARGGHLLVRESYGTASVRPSRANAPALRYRIGSLTKPLTATLVMQLVGQGQLKLDGTLGEYLPDLYAGTAAAPVTIAQLLSHTSGLADVPGRYDDPWWQTTARERWTPADFARHWIKPEMVEAPGTQFRYNNNGFFLLGLIVERITGKSYAENMRQRIFMRAGMTNSGVFTSATPTADFAVGYAVSPAGQPTTPILIDPSVSFSAAGMYSTVDDLLRFDHALYGTMVLDSAGRQAMMTAHAKEYGYGWNVDSYALPGGRMLPVVSHTGSVPGYQSYYLRSEQNRDCIIILDNYWQGTLVAQMGRDLIEVLNGKPMQLVKYSIDSLLTPIAYSQGFDAMVATYDRLGNRARDYDLSENAFNALGYKFLRNKKNAEAIQVLQWATQRYPRSANAFDSLGEAYRAAGLNAKSIENYERALALDPQSKSAKAALTDLREAR